jgi:hypothetical protein
MTAVKITRAWLRKLDVDEFTAWANTHDVKWDIPRISFFDRYPEKETVTIEFENELDATAFAIRYTI